ncbi:hypothetical protein F5Y19DRAFT_462979 [Xylariaceae sp. FL1651]|nr:hypothetical protein F5Y19DRAFT_462979 [Xylariaceae sp. FL1651]
MATQEAQYRRSLLFPLKRSKREFLEDSRYRYMVLVEMGECLEEAIRDMPRNESRLKACGELAVVYRQLSKLDDSKRACEEQYETAIQIRSEREIIRAISNLGMANYQLFLLNNKQEYLSLAIDQLEERVDRCRQVRSATTSVLNKQEKHAAKLSLQSGDPSKLAFSRLFLGRFNPSDGNTPVAVLSKKPSEEHRGYIRKMINAGADLTLRNVHKYSALDYAVYGGNKTTQNVILERLRRSLKPDEIEAHHLESMLHKGYQELFQDRLRPVLSHPDKQSSIKRLRQVYATLAIDKKKACQFDMFKYIRYADFVRFSRLPKSTDSLTRYFEARKLDGEFIPDNMQNTRYHHIIRAFERFLAIDSSIDHPIVGIWIDWACIDQVDKDTQARVIAALPMCIAQCNAMISIINPMATIQVLQKSCNGHHWFEHKEDSRKGEKDVLRYGSLSELPSIASAKLTLESDRLKVNFLERQAKLLDNPVGA